MTKHKPATPLLLRTEEVTIEPRRKRGHVQRYVQVCRLMHGDEIVAATAIDSHDPHRARFDSEAARFKEIAHAANAYPRLVEALASMLALNAATCPTAEYRTRTQGDARALLRELGEDA